MQSFHLDEVALVILNLSPHSGNVVAGWIFQLVSYLRRIRGCWALSSCESCLSSQWKIWKGLSSVWEGWTLGSETWQGGTAFSKPHFTRYPELVCVLELDRDYNVVSCCCFYKEKSIILSQRRHSLCFIYDDRFGGRGEFRWLLAVVPRSKTTQRGGQKPWT